MAHSRDGRFFATVSGFRIIKVSSQWEPARVESVTIWDTMTSQEIRTLPIPDPTAVACHDVAFDPGFGRIAWARGDGTIGIRDATTGRLIHTLSGHTDLVLHVAYSPDGRRLASASRDGTVVWDAETGRSIHRQPGIPDPPGFLRFSPDSRRLATSSKGGTARIFDAATGRQFLSPVGSFMEENADVAFHPREGRVACSNGSDVLILDLFSGRKILRLRGHTEWIDSIAFSPDGRRLASGGRDGTVKLWEPATGREILSLLHGRGEPGHRRELQTRRQADRLDQHERDREGLGCDAVTRAFGEMTGAH